MLSTTKIKQVDSIVSFIVDLHKTTWFHATVWERNSCENVSLESVSSFKYRMQSENEKKHLSFDQSSRRHDTKINYIL